MKYIIMCGGNYEGWEMPRQLIKIKSEPVVARTIRLLREYGIKDIAISTNDRRFANCGVPILRHDNHFIGYDDQGGYWVDCFYPMTSPVCYLLGDVVFSPDAIRTIVQTQTDDIAFFASAPPFASSYIKRWAEPFAFKVTDTEHFFKAVQTVREYQDKGKFYRIAIAWELWQIIKNTPINHIRYDNYQVINDYTCDIDKAQDAIQIERLIE